MNYHDVWIVVPAYNEATVIGDVIADVRSVFEHVVCVDDGSTDATSGAALRAGAHVVTHPVNLGQGAAIQTGVEYARRQPGAAIFATFDADGQHRVKDLVKMIDRLCATVASALLLLLPLELEVRTVVALLCGPLLGIAVHLAVLARVPTA